jgi:peptidoglycan-N-acetylglucosamine deacetylase
MYWVKTPSILKPLSRDLLWSVKTADRVLYLTFDDGPTPGVTEDVLNLLQNYQAKATFFCLGKHVEMHPSLYAQIRVMGHGIGLHSYDHPDGWKTCTFAYVRNVLRGGKHMDTTLYRPPYGHITPAQLSLLKKRYRVVMWDVLSADWDASNSPEQCAFNVISHAKAGSIVVFHDSEKALPRMLPALRATLEHFAQLGFHFAALPE